jgi:hypothetical protein
MKPTLLLPRYFKIIGFITAATGIIIGALFEFDDRYLPFLDYNSGYRSPPLVGLGGGNNFTDEVATTLAILGLMLIGFSKFKLENQQTAILRLKALYWAVLVNAGLVAVLVTDLSFSHGVNLAINNNFFLLLIIFIGRLYYLKFIRKEQTKLYYLPHWPFSLVGKVSSIVLITVGLVISIYNFKPGRWADFLPCLILPCILLWIWSKEKTENEEIEATRLKAMRLSILINCGAFVILTWAIYGFNYLTVQFAALISVQLVFAIIFYALIYKASKSDDQEPIITPPVIS